MDRALEYFCRAAEDADSPLGRAVANVRECICKSSRILRTLFAPSGKGWSSPVVRPGGMAPALGPMRTLSRTVKDAARGEPPFLRVFDARFGYLIKYNLPVPKAVSVAAVSRDASAPANVQPQPTLKLDSVAPARCGVSSPPKSVCQKSSNW